MERKETYATTGSRMTVRWTCYDAKRFGIKMPDKVPMATQERAYTSPIRYTPSEGTGGECRVSRGECRGTSEGKWASVNLNNLELIKRPGNCLILSYQT